MVKSDGDYSAHMSDPDLLVAWNQIEEIHIDSHEPISCPICLYEPTAGKMTKCGHIYCWSCLLHYLSLSDKAWRKCPICYESIYKQDLKSVRVLADKRNFKVGDQLELRLMFKPKQKACSALILPIDVFDQYKRELAPKQTTLPPRGNFFNALSKSVRHGERFFKLNCKEVREIEESVLRRERSELSRQIEAEREQPEVCFAQEALGLLEQREASLISDLKESSIVSAPVDIVQPKQTSSGMCRMRFKLGLARKRENIVLFKIQ